MVVLKQQGGRTPQLITRTKHAQTEAAAASAEHHCGFLHADQAGRS